MCHLPVFDAVEEYRLAAMNKNGCCEGEETSETYEQRLIDIKAACLLATERIR